MNRTLKLRLDRETLKQLTARQLDHAAAGDSLNCSSPGNSLCLWGCQTGVTCHPCE